MTSTEGKPMTLAERRSMFEKSPTNASAGTNDFSASSKVAQLKANLQKKETPAATTSTATASKPVVVRSNSANKLPTTLTATADVNKTIPRSQSAGKLVTESQSLPAAPKAVVAAPKPLAAKPIPAKSVVARPAPKPISKMVAAEATTTKAPLTKVIPNNEVEVKEEEPEPVKDVKVNEPVKSAKPDLTIQVDTSVEPIRAYTPTAFAAQAQKLKFAADLSIPPTVEEQDYYVLWGLSFVVPFFMLRFVFELVRKCVLGPARMTVRFAPGLLPLLSFLYVKLGPLAVKGAHAIRDRLPPMDAVNNAAKAGLEKFLATLQTAAGAAWPHLLHLGESIKTLRFREAAKEVINVLKAWAPMLLLLIPLTKNAFVAARQGWIVFWRVSKKAVYLPFGRVLRGAVQSFGKSLSENPDVFAENVAGLLGPIVGVAVSFILLVGLGLMIGAVNYETLSSLYIAWFFKLIGMVSEPSLLDQASVGQIDDHVNVATKIAVDASAMSVDDATAAAAAGSSGGGWVW